jgi:hypothetical protein
LKFESGVVRQAEGEGVSREDAKVIIFQKFRPDPDFLDCGGWTPLLIFPSTRSIPIQSSIQPEHSKTPSWPQNVLGNSTTWARELTENLLLPFLRAFASSRETLPQGIPSGVQLMSVGFHPDTSAIAFAQPSTFAFNLQVKPGKFPNPFHGPIGSAWINYQQFFNCGILL